MRLQRSLCAVLLALGSAGTAAASPYVIIRGAAVRVVVIPEARTDIAVTVLKHNPRLPLRVARFGEKVSVIGDVHGRTQSCPKLGGRPAVRIAGRGTIAYDDLPEVVIHTPLAARVSAGEAVFGVIGRSGSLDFTNQGCGEWTLANVLGRARLSQSGSGATRTGSAGSADLSVAGSGMITTRTVRRGVIAISSGAGDIVMAEVFGPMNLRVAGSGDIRAPAGRVTALTAAIAGSGSIRFGGVAQSLQASVAGAGDVIVAEVTGPVNRRVFGSGAVRVGRPSTP